MLLEIAPAERSQRGRGGLRPSARLAAPLAALDLPLRVLVWVDGYQTKVSYTAPATLAARYGLDGELRSRLAGIDAITNAVIDK